MKRILAALLAAVAVAAAGCHERPPAEAASAKPSAGPVDPQPEPSQEHLAALQADYPRVMLASDTATNYAPPGWPLKPGARVTGAEATHLLEQFGSDDWVREAVVWVVRENDPATATPFGAWWSWEKGVLPGQPDPATWQDGYHWLYHGHLPVRTWMVGFGAQTIEEDLAKMEAELPPSLRGFVDHRRHDADADYVRRKKSFSNAYGSEGKRAFADAERKRYYGPDASW